MIPFPRIARCLAVFLITLPIAWSWFPAAATAQVRRGLPLPKKTLIPEEGLEVEMLRHKRLPMIEAKINGKGPFTFVLDTGAGTNVLDPKLADELELVSTGTTRLGDPSAPNAIEANTYELESMSVAAVVSGGAPSTHATPPRPGSVPRAARGVAAVRAVTGARSGRVR